MSPDPYYGFEPSALSLYDLAHPVLFDVEAGTRRDGRGVLKRIVGHDGDQYRVTMWSGVGIALADGHRQFHLARREAAVEEALQRLGRKHDAGVSPGHRSFWVSALVSKVQRDLQLAGQVFSFAEISGAVQL